MKALTFNPQQDQFHLADVAEPIPGDSDVLVKVDACGLNPVDAKIVYWKSVAPDIDENWVPGLDVSGHIVEIGKDVREWKVGDRILCHGNMFRPHGGFAEYTIQNAETLTPHPQVSAEIAAATPCAGWTAWRALNDKLHAQLADSILIYGGSGGVGGFAIQIARYFEIQRIIVTCSARNESYVKELGATHVIDYHSEDVLNRVLMITDQLGADVALDTVGPDNDVIVANALAVDGQMVEIVGTVKPSAYRDVFARGLSFHQLSLGSGHRNGPKAKAALTLAGTTFSTLIDTGHITVPVLKTISLAEVGLALNEILKQRTVGKIVMKM